MQRGDRDTSLLFYHYNDDRASKVILRDSNTELLPAPAFRAGPTRRLSSAGGRLSSSGGFGTFAYDHPPPHSHEEVHGRAMIVWNIFCNCVFSWFLCLNAFEGQQYWESPCCVTGFASARYRTEYSWNRVALVIRIQTACRYNVAVGV